ncbi:MAG: hypothetical protein MK106_04635 [Mariniblastus sp.]|nr:hypothetical protein [Mariniblastus sp.]
MKNSLILSVCLVFLGSACCCGQRGNSNQGTRSAMDVPDNPQAVGDAGVAWYTTWETGLSEARRSNRPIFFMSAATTCSGISGVF